MSLPLLRTLALGLLLCPWLTMPVTAHAADSEGRFAVKGAGAARCEDFLAAREGRGKRYFMYAGWVEGYLSAANLYERESFDLAPWQNTEVLVTLLARVCRQAPEESVHTALGGMMQLLYPTRLQRRSPLLALETDGQGVALYAEVLQRVRTRLAKDGYLDAGAADAASPSALDAATAEALARYQQARAIPVTRLPDMLTLVHLFTDVGDAPVGGMAP